MTARLRVLLVDDERPARSKLARFLAADVRFELVGEAEDGVEALEQIDRLLPDVVFLDVQMPGLSGFDVLDAVGAAPQFVVVFSTAYDQHALRAFEAHALDYLLKPYAAERFQRALDKVHAQCLGARPNYTALTLALAPKPRDRLVLRLVHGSWLQLGIDTVSYVVAAKKHTRVVCGAQEHLVRMPFHELASRLDERFARSHRSEIVRLGEVERVEPWQHGDMILVLRNGQTRVVSRTFRKTFMERLDSATLRRV